jgi:hypothetical protein
MVSYVIPTIYFISYVHISCLPLFCLTQSRSSLVILGDRACIGAESCIDATGGFCLSNNEHVVLELISLVIGLQVPSMYPTKRLEDRVLVLRFQVGGLFRPFDCFPDYKYLLSSTF